MELFGICFSVPAAFVASMVYCYLLLNKVQRFGRVCLWLKVASLIVLAMFLAEMCLLGSFGIVGSREIVGPAFYLAHSVVFFLGTPALANVLVLRPIACKWYLAAVICAIFGVFLVLLQYGVSEALYGINGNDGPYS